MTQARPAAVLWDMDGTLVDTEPYWMDREREIVGAHGNGRWTIEHAHAVVGFDLRDTARFMIEHGEIRLDAADPVDAVVELLLDGVIARVAERVPWRPGARELLAELGAAGIPCALVTMSWTRFVDAVLPVLPAGSFAAVVTGDEVVHGKPHPEPYLVAAARLGVDPKACVAIEDSPTGARSAAAAGCCTVVVPNAVNVPARLGDHVLDSLEGLTVPALSGLFASCRAAPHGGSWPQ